MNTVKAVDFDISAEIADGDEAIYIFGPMWPNVILASRREALTISKQIRQCCSKPFHFGFDLSGGDRFFVSHWEGMVVIRSFGITSHLDPDQAQLVADAIVTASLQLPPATPLAA